MIEDDGSRVSNRGKMSKRCTKSKMINKNSKKRCITLVTLPKEERKELLFDLI